MGKADLKIVHPQADLDRETGHERKGETLRRRVNFAELSRSLSVVVVVVDGAVSESVVMVRVDGRSRFAHPIDAS